MQRQNSRIDGLAQYETGLYAADAVDAGQFAEQEFLIMIHVRHDHFQQIIRGLAGDQVAFEHLGPGADKGFEVFEPFRRVQVHADLNYSGQLQLQLGLIQQGHMAVDEAAVFELFDSS